MKRSNNSTAADTNAVQPGETEDVLQAISLETSLAPALPEYAHLTDAQITTARQTGQWLDAFVAFASIASPLTPPGSSWVASPLHAGCTWT